MRPPKSGQNGQTMARFWSRVSPPDGRWEEQIRIPGGGRRLVYARTRREAVHRFRRSAGPLGQGLPVSAEATSLETFLGLARSDGKYAAAEYGPRLHGRCGNAMPVVNNHVPFLTRVLNVTDIRVDITGLITSGRWAGQTIRIDDQRAHTGGYLVIIGLDATGEQAGDIWVEASQLDKAFDDAGWIVAWQGDDMARAERRQ